MHQELSTRVTGPKAYRNFPHAVRSIYNSHGFVGGFFSGVGPCTLKVAMNTCIRFTVYNQAVQVTWSEASEQSDS